MDYVPTLLRIGGKIQSLDLAENNDGIMFFFEDGIITTGSRLDAS